MNFSNEGGRVNAFSRMFNRDLNFVVENSYQKQIIIQRRVFLERIFKLIA